MNEMLLSKKQAAAFLGIAPRTLDDWRKSRCLACIERPGYVRFLQTDLEAFLERHRKQAKTASAFRPRIKTVSPTATEA